jgi:two-component system, chemotaxis family, response regulator Rcp1
VFLVKEALKLNDVQCELIVKADGSDVLTFLEAIETGDVLAPDIVLLDLNLPRLGGHMLLERFRQSRRSSQVPIVIVTSSDSPQDRELTHLAGATRYFRKPSDYDEFMKLGSIVRQLLY